MVVDALLHACSPAQSLPLGSVLLQPVLKLQPVPSGMKSFGTFLAMVLTVIFRGVKRSIAQDKEDIDDSDDDVFRSRFV